MGLQWSIKPFCALYDAISVDDSSLKQALINELSEDLVSLIVTKPKNEVSRNKLQTGEVTFSDGSIYKLNKAFIDDSVQLSTELEIDELDAAELLYHASGGELDSLGTSYLDTAIAAFYNRRDYILQIMAFFLCSKESNNSMDEAYNSSLVSNSDGNKSIATEISNVQNFAITKILGSFKLIERELESIHEAVNRMKILGTYHENSPSMQKLTFRRNSLFNEYQLLGEILLGYVNANLQKAFTMDHFIQLLDHVSLFDPQDIFALCFVPSLLCYISKLDILDTATVEKLHLKLISYVDDLDKLSESPLKSFIILAFLTSFIEWCKKDQARTSRFEFSTAVDKPMQLCISVGALEQLLSICADTSIIETSLYHRMKPFYDFRTFLQQHIPKYSPTRIIDVDQDETSKQNGFHGQDNSTRPDVLETGKVSVCNTEAENRLGEHFINLLVSSLNSFILSFISTAAFVMSQLRDAEEDFLLSSDTFDLEVLAENADLERLYMSVYYLYSERQHLSSEIWADPTSATYGFLQWASRCNSPLVMATFSMLLAGLASTEDNAINVFTFLQSTNSINSGLITSPKENSSLLTKYSSISWSTIYSTLLYYCDAFTKTSELTFDNLSSELGMEVKDKKKIVLELGEDSIIYISGFFQVLSEVARKSSKARIELLESDNNQLFKILFKLLNLNTSLDGPILSLLSSLAGDTKEERSKLWSMLDAWVFQNNRKNAFINFPVQKISQQLSSYQSVCGFIDLASKLLEPLETSKDEFAPFTLPFALDFGSTLRRPGVKCYIDYFTNEVFASLDSTEVSCREKNQLKYSILSMMQLCLEQLDTNLVLNSSAAGIKDLDQVIEDKSVIRYFQAHPASSVLLSLYNDRVYDAIFKICNVGFDRINSLHEDSAEIVIIEKSLTIIDIVLSSEKFLSDELIPILRLPDNPYMDPSEVSMTGLRSFSEALLLNLPLVANFALYVGSNKLSIALKSLSIIRKLTASKAFSSNKVGSQNLMKRNSMLVMYETVDESIRIRSSFIEQMEAPISSRDALDLKLSILDYIKENLVINGHEPTVSHFLLGLDTYKMGLGSTDQDTSVSSNRSLLKSILNTLRDAVFLMSTSKVISFVPIRICALGMEIITTLCKSDKVGKNVLQFLRSNSSHLSSKDSSNFIVFLLENFSKVHKNYVFDGKKFNGDFNVDNDFVSTGNSMCALNLFFAFRSCVLELTAIELHVSMLSNLPSLCDKYVKLLTRARDLASGSFRLMDFLDVLDFSATNNIEHVDALFNNLDFNYIFQKIKLSGLLSTSNEYPYDLSLVDELVSLLMKSSSRFITPLQKSDSLKLFDSEKSKLKKIITCSISFDGFKSCVSNYLSSWSLLVKVIVSEIEIDVNSKLIFILDTFQHIVPKIDEFLEKETVFAKELIELCVHLLHVYNDERKNLYLDLGERSIGRLLDFERLYPVFKVSLHGIISATSTSALRSDLYIMAQKVLEGTSGMTTVTGELSTLLRSLDTRVFDVIRHDSLVGKGSNRLTSLLLLEEFVKAFLQSQTSYIQEEFISESFCIGNYLYSLVKNLKVTDEIFCRTLDMTVDSGITLQTLVYELTAFKTSVSFLTRVAQTRIGAQKLLRSDIFNVIRDCKFLQLDADLGFEIRLDDSTRFNKGSLKMKVMLDYPLGTDLSLNGTDTINMDTISYYEIFRPIFQLIVTIVITLGPQNSTCLLQATELHNHFEKLIAAILKRDIQYHEYTESHGKIGKSVKGPFSERNIQNLEELTKIFTILDTLLG